MSFALRVVLLFVVGVVCVMLRALRNPDIPDTDKRLGLFLLLVLRTWSETSLETITVSFLHAILSLGSIILKLILSVIDNVTMTETKYSTLGEVL